ncbi:hypothetical protein Pan181_23480 [Aeoliella mucimassa]|uniref:Putative beta-lactamase-inhibitor-like PepSY-like domain-containing protein n=2 Tax=Aeoliella mucimassa TaxID=2527972 RepID=A0A518AN43_9BACT|nr:hypothetical protein Pan181_23480 [Aeoliella mucimassa]
MIASPQVSPHLSKAGLLALCCGVVILVCSPSNAAEDTIPLKQCPKTVQKAIKSEATGGKILEIEREDSDSTVQFEAEIEFDGNVYEVTVDNDGKLLSKELVDEEETDAEENEEAEHEEDDDDQDGEEVVGSFSELPQAVKSTLKRETRGGEIEEIERETEDGRVIYSADVEYESDSGELVYEVEIAEDGVLLSKVLEQEEAEEHEHGDHQEDHDDKDEEQEHESSK